MEKFKINKTNSLRMKKLILLISLCFCISFIAKAGGGWPQKKGHGYFKLSQWWIIADEHFTDVGLKDPNITNALYNTSIYAEYGFTDRLTGILYAPFFSRALFNNTVSGTTGEVIDPGEAINALGDFDISLKYGLISKGSFALSATLTLGIPLGENAGGDIGVLQTGDGEFNQLVQVDAGIGFPIGNINAYANVYTGINNRTQGFSDEFRFGFEVGANLFQDKVIGIVRFLGVESFNNGTLPSEATGTTIFANNTEHFTFAPEIAYKLTNNFGVSAGLSKALSGRLIYANTAYNVGVFLTI